MEARRHAVVLVVLAFVIAGLGTVVPSRAQASYYEDGVWMRGEVVREGVTYELDLKVIQPARAYPARLEVSISKLEDPAGSTVLRQTQTWEFPLDQGDFRRNGSTYYIDAGSGQEPFLLQATVTTDWDSRCSDQQNMYVTPSSDAAFRVETGNSIFGTITEIPACGQFWSYSDGPPEYPDCPVRGLELRSDNIHVKERRFSDIARLALHQAAQRDIAGHAVSWSVRVEGTLPAAAFRLNRDLDGSLSVGQAPWLEGTARFRSEGPPVRGEWFDCTGEREARSRTASGAIKGDLTLYVIGFEPYPFIEPEAWALRSRVRPR